MASQQRQQQQQQPPPPTDHWSSKAYNTAASFVPKLTSKVLSYLNPQPGEHILDLGCGDGILTAQIAEIDISTGGGPVTGHVVGLDSSPSFIASVRQAYPNIEFEVQDCTALRTYLDTKKLHGSFDKVFSNAALHWILRRPETRTIVFADAYTALKPGGLLAFEMGGHGNVGEVHAALIAGLAVHGVPLAEVKELSPWFFPSEKWAQVTLENVGFEVLKAEMEDRPTLLTAKGEKEDGGLKGWVELMGAHFLERLEGEQRAHAVKWICDILEAIVTREEDGSQWLQYKRLRAVARKK